MLNPAGIRHVTFDSSCLFASPGSSSLDKIHIASNEPWGGDIQWLYLANACPGEHSVGGCFPDRCGTNLQAQDGSLKYYEISKCHTMLWRKGRVVTILTSPLGDEYILHATTEAENAKRGRISGKAVYPHNWVVSTRILEEDLQITPEPDDSSSFPFSIGGRSPFGEYPCGYALIQDSVGNAYHRIKNVSGAPEGINQLLFGLTPPEIFGAIHILKYLSLSLLLLFLIYRTYKCFGTTINTKGKAD